MSAPFGAGERLPGARAKSKHKLLPNQLTHVDSAVRTDIDAHDPWVAIEACYAAGWTDGLPVVPPTDALVYAMLSGGPWAPTDVLLEEPVRAIRVTAEKAAINAVMAGCRPSYFPVLGAVLQAMGEPEYVLHGVATSTGGAGTVIIVNGPIRETLGINAKEGLLSPGFRANATIGRAIRLVLLNCLGSHPGVLDKSTQGWPGKYACCFAEREDASPWEPLHVSRGWRAEQSTVTIFAAESPHNILNHAARTAEGLLTTFVDAIRALGSFSSGRSVVLFCPEHARRFERDEWSRRRVQEFLYENCRRTLAELKHGGKIEGDIPDDPGDDERWVHRGEGPEDYLLLVGGGDAGGHSAFFPSWSRRRGAAFITKEIPT